VSNFVSQDSLKLTHEHMQFQKISRGYPGRPIKKGKERKRLEGEIGIGRVWEGRKVREIGRREGKWNERVEGGDGRQRKGGTCSNDLRGDRGPWGAPSGSAKPEATRCRKVGKRTSPYFRHIASGGEQHRKAAGPVKQHLHYRRLQTTCLVTQYIICSE
jgi:hypothetical protein